MEDFSGKNLKDHGRLLSFFGRVGSNPGNTCLENCPENYWSESDYRCFSVCKDVLTGLHFDFRFSCCARK